MAEKTNYEINTRWLGERRSTSTEGKLEILVGYPPRFGKAEPAWTPEELMLSAFDLSLMSAFLEGCMRAGIRPPLTWEGRGKAEVTFSREEGRQVKSMVLIPRITMPRWEDMEPAQEVIKEATERFHIKPAVGFPLSVEPELIPGPNQGREGVSTPLRK